MVRHSKGNYMAAKQEWVRLLAELQGLCLVTQLSSMAGRA